MPEVPKKPAPEEKVPHVPKVEEAPPAKGTMLFTVISFIVAFRTLHLSQLAQLLCFVSKICPCVIFLNDTFLLRDAMPVLHFIGPKSKYLFFKCLGFLRNLFLKKKYLLLFLKKLRLLQLKVCFPAE